MQHDWRLKVVVFVSGAVLMGLEMTGSRILAIHFGSSIYVWGAIIGVFLAALSIGYYSGGMLADRRPSFYPLNALLLIAGGWLMVIPFYANPVCRLLLRFNPGERLGPLLATLILFGGPSVLLGMVSPYAVRLAAQTVERIGNVSGSLYALSTFGSIAGTLLTAFWLVPALGVRTLLQILGVCLLVLPLIVVPWSRKKAGVAAAIVLFASILIVLSYIRAVPAQGVIYEGDSAYHYIKVVDDNQRNIRYLQFNNYIEGAIDLNPPYDTRVSYTNAFHLARIFNPKPKNILIIGGGGGIGARKFVTDDPNVTVDLVEIDQRVVDLGLKYFHLEPSNRLRIHVEDGRSFVRRSQTKYDLVILDAFTIGGQIPFHLTTREFFNEIRQTLSPDGVVLANINGTMRGRRSRIMRSEYKTLGTVFPNVYLFPHLQETERRPNAILDQDRPRSIILIAVNGGERWTKESVMATATQLEQSRVVLTPTFLEDAQQFFEARLPTDDVPLLTDDYAPVDTMVF
ncbi:MAG TPA: fused MFS/spermidine synthase [Pyrinomonadaceae bacterium]|nr:fused MFS/spermidine synthase [Pyrinomonadaceae bacterium]